MTGPGVPSGQRTRHRVVVTGAGMVTPLGGHWAANASGFREGRTTFRDVGLFDVSAQRVRRAAEIPVLPELPRTRLSRRRAARLDRAGRLLLAAVNEALEAARWRPTGPVPMILGTTSGQMALGEAFYRHSAAAARWTGQASRCLGYQPQTQAGEVQEAFGIEGPVVIVSNACASGADAIGEAWHWIRHGFAERVIAGGYEALNQLVFAGFDSLQALSPTTCRPFDAHRDGLGLGEGAAIFVMESLDSAARRGATVIGEVMGYAARTDLHHLTQPHPEGTAALAAMHRACAAAGVSPRDVGYINAHGTGTVTNDGSEATAIVAWAGGDAPWLAVSSTKALIGHTLGAAGAIEFGVCLMSLSEGWLPPMRMTGTPDPACRFRLVQQPETTSCAVALTNSFGFGGANATLVVGRPA